MSHIVEWLRREDSRLEDIFGLWVQGKRDDSWVAEKLVSEGHLDALLDVKRGYTVLVSSIPALYRSWRDSPNETARSMNRTLLDAAIEWCQSYQRDVQGRDPDDYSEYAEVTP